MFKRKITMLLTLSLLLSVMLGTVSYAGNIQDSGFEFFISASHTEQYTDEREKQDTTSTYVRALDMPSIFIYCDVQGKHFSEPNWTAYWSNETVGGTVELPLGEWFIRQNVYENGARSARLWLRKFNQNGMVYGLWSPDSVGSYPSLN